MIIIGPTVCILDNFSSTLLSYFKHLPKDSFRVSPPDPKYTLWVKDWTVFYWAWFIALVLSSREFLKVVLFENSFLASFCTYYILYFMVYCIWRRKSVSRN
nr:BCCT family transporter [Alteribacillus bidgolensis]